MVKKSSPVFETTRLIVYGFLVVIILGAILLSLPISSADGRWTNFLDAFFTATTATCVTGLVVVPTYSYWSVFGKIIIFMLIQLGGLGVICISMGVFLLIKKKITLKERRLIQESYNLNNYGGMVKVILAVFKITFVIEGIGAVLYSIKFIPIYGVKKGILYSIFHSVSAFCNAGLDLLGDVSLGNYANDILFNITTIFLIVSGGLGFIVWWEIKDLTLNVINKNVKYNKIVERISLHSKLVIASTTLFIIGGAVIIFISEFSNPYTIGRLPLVEKVTISVFQSVTLRTAGFSTISQVGFQDATLLVMCFLMLVGGSPIGTAGGIKTTTVAVLYIEVLSVIKGKKNAEVFRRRISRENVRVAISVTFISVFVLAIGIMLLTVTEQGASMKKVIFEAFSAIATVGLSMDFTSELSNCGKIIISIMMFLGRVGPITMAMAFVEKRKRAIDRDYSEERIIIG